MAQSKHTPGPWEVVPLSGYGGPFAIRMPMPPGAKHPTHYGVQAVGDEANARLIAAAPELLAALKSLDRMTRGLDWCDSDEQARRWADTRAAIAKATGGQP